MIYISTGGFKNMTPTESIKYFNKNGINNIELSIIGIFFPGKYLLSLNEVGCSAI